MSSKTKKIVLLHLLTSLLLTTQAQAADDVKASDTYFGIELAPMSVNVSNKTPNTIITNSVSTSGTNTTTDTTTSSQLMRDEETYSPLTLRARLGLTILPDFYPVVSLESHLGFDLTDDTQKVHYNDTSFTRSIVRDGSNTILSDTTSATVTTLQSKDVALKLDAFVGFYVRGDFRITEDANAYLLLGVASAQLSGPFGNYGLPTDDTESGLSYGLGGTYQLPWSLKAYIEATQLLDGPHYKISGVAIGVMADIE